MKVFGVGPQNTGERLEIIRATGDGGGRQRAALDQSAIPIDVAEDGLDQFRALHDAGRDLPPVVGTDEQRQMPDRPAFLVAVSISAVGDAAVERNPHDG